MGWPAGSRVGRRPGRSVRVRHHPDPARRLRRVLAYSKLQAVIGDADELIDPLALAVIVVTPTEAVELIRDPTMTGS